MNFGGASLSIFNVLTLDLLTSSWNYGKNWGKMRDKDLFLIIRKEIRIFLIKSYTQSTHSGPLELCLKLNRLGAPAPSPPPRIPADFSPPLSPSPSMSNFWWNHLVGYPRLRFLGPGIIRFCA